MLTQAHYPLIISEEINVSQVQRQMRARSVSPGWYSTVSYGT